MRVAWTRITAGVGTLCVLATLTIVWIARFGVPRDVYVSELGAVGEPTAGWFEIALLLLAAGGCAIAWAGRGIRTVSPVLRWWPPSISLTIASLLFLVASQVTCTTGCPLPRIGPDLSWQDLGHVTAATLAFGFAAWTMLQCAFAVGHRAIRRFSLVAAMAVAVIAGVGGLMSVFDFYAWFGSRLEFVATTIGIAWVAVYGLALAFERKAFESAASAFAAHRPQQVIGENDEAPDLGVIALDPATLGLARYGHELVVSFPHDESALGT